MGKKSHPAIYEIARELRQTSTLAEKMLWEQLRGRGLKGKKFRRQHPLGPFILDFYCIEERLAIEVDGPIHNLQTEQDLERTQMLNALGCRVLRFTNEEIEHYLPEALNCITNEFKR
jgi:5-methyltetrahydrofolate--homocysteine methyltransferase